MNNPTILIGGCGALGSNIAMQIARPGMNFILVDNDQIDSDNVDSGTTVYSQEHIGKWKADVMAELLYRKYGIRSKVHNKDLGNVKFDLIFDLVIDCFDNITARSYTIPLLIRAPIIHIGVSPQRIGAIEWHKTYKLPKNTQEPNEFCTHEVGRNLINFTSAVASITISHFFRIGEMKNYILNDQPTIY